MKRRVPTSLYLFASAGILLGALVSTLSSEERRGWAGSLLGEMEQLTHLEPIRVAPRVEMSLVALEARRALDAGRPWEAWRKLQGHVEEPEATAGYVLLAARSAAAWEGWDHVREVLEGREWLERAEGGEGLYLLARALQELDEEKAAAEAYARYAALPGARRAGEAYARLGAALAARGELTSAASAFDRAADRMPQIADWLRTLQIEQLAAAGKPLSVSLIANSSPVTPPVRLRRVRAEAGFRASTGDVAGALRKLEWEERVLDAQEAVDESSQLRLTRARLLIDNGRSEEARELLRRVAWQTGALGSTREEAARLLGELPRNVAADELARAAGYEAAGKPGLAARSIRAALADGAADQAGLQLKLARLLYDERDYGPARTAFQRAAEELTEPELVAEASLYAARSLYRSGSRTAAIAELRKVVERHPNTAAAGSALFLLGDEAPSLREALGFYRRAAAVGHSEDAREALYRVGDRSLRLKDPAGAIRAWEDYVARYPTGEATAQVAYETGKLHEKAGREAAARAMYRAALSADPVSYYAFRAGSRLGVHPIDQVLTEPRPWVGLASDPGAAQAVLRRLDALADAGLSAEWSQELASALRVMEERPAAVLVLAEGLRDRGHPVQAIQLGRQLLRQREDQWDPRLLRVVFPFPYRQLIEAEGERADVDPALLAGLIRQESMFRHDATSWVGATGLSQIMPATGRWLASTIGIRSFETRLLTVPEVNLRMGARYLGDQLRSYDGSRDLALAAYNAGPSRATRWRRTLDHGGDTDAFREAIPFDETRHYVKVVLRNAAIYERLYAEERPVGLVHLDDR